MFKRILCLIASILLLLILSQVVVAASTIIEPAYEIIDTGILGRREAYWIDNQRVLFPGYDQTRSRAAGSGSSPATVLYIWDLNTRQAKIYADIPETDYVCYSDGFISYAVSRDGQRYIREGMFGAEKERQWNPPATGSKIDRNEITCKEFDLVTRDKVYPDFWFIPLREKDGYYGGQKKESFVESSMSPMFYLPKGKNKKPIALPIKGGEKDRISYSEYLGAYVIEYTPSVRRKDTTGKIWLLYPNGTVTESIVPAGPWMHGSVGYVPAREGIIMWSTALGLRSRFDPGHAGIYLINGNKVERLISGFPGRPVAVSPDGCKIAAIVDPHMAPEQKATLRIINLCKQEK